MLGFLLGDPEGCSTGACEMVGVILFEGIRVVCELETDGDVEGCSVLEGGIDGTPDGFIEGSKGCDT